MTRAGLGLLHERRRASRLASVALVALLAAAGCGASQRPGAPVALTLRADAGAVSRPGFGAGGSLGFEANGCCGFGTYVTYWGLPDEGALLPDDAAAVQPADAGAAAATAAEPADDPRAVDRILDGGLEIEVLSPGLPDLRLRARGGLAGTPPTTTSLGRRGFAASLALVYRLGGSRPVEVAEVAPVVDVLLGVQSWSFESERTSAGADDSTLGGAALLLGVRLGAGYGLDLR